MDRRFGDAIVSVAMAEAVPPPYGKVNDHTRVLENGRMTELRFGWERLKEYFEVAAKFTDQHWKIPGYLDGVRINNRRVAGTQWCGIFATWCWIEAGVPGIHWAMPGIKGPGVKLVAGHEGIAKGDIGVLKGGLVHHFVVTNVGEHTVSTVNGNSMWQGITTRDNKKSEISYYYTLEEPAFYNYLRDNYGS